MNVDESNDFSYALLLRVIGAQLSIVLGKYCGSKDLVLGVPVDLREEKDRDAVGMFVNTAPVRTRPEGDKPLSLYLTENAETIRAATREFVLPFAEVAAEFVPEPDSARHPVFDVGLNYLRLPEPLYDETSGISIAFSYELQRLRRDLNLTVYRGKEENKDGASNRAGESLRFVAQYSSALFEDGVIERFLEQLKVTLSAMTRKEENGSGTDADCSVSRVAALPKEHVSQQAKPWRFRKSCCIGCLKIRRKSFRSIPPLSQATGP